MSKLNDLLLDIEAEFPAFKLVRKDDSKFMKVLAVLVKPFCPTFMEHFGTTIGKTVYVPRDWSEQTMYEVLRHERVHIRDSDKWGPLYYLSYLLFPLPFVFSGRAFWEFRGYCESLKTWWEGRGSPVTLKGEPVIFERDIEWCVEQFTGATYGFMFPFASVLRKAFKKASLKWVA